MNTSSCHFPSWAYGIWQDVYVEDDTLACKKGSPQFQDLYRQVYGGQSNIAGRSEQIRSLRSHAVVNISKLIPSDIHFEIHLK